MSSGRPDEAAGPASSEAAGERGGDRKASGSGPASRTDLGCLLGAFRDVAYSIGMQVLAVTLRARREGEATGQARGATGLPKGRPRRELKLIALVQTFSDNVAHEGYVIENIDMKPVPEGKKEKERKTWKVKVVLKGAPAQS